jgi:hypothetical protein
VVDLVLPGRRLISSLAGEEELGVGARVAEHAGVDEGVDQQGVGVGDGPATAEGEEARVTRTHADEGDEARHDGGTLRPRSGAVALAV